MKLENEERILKISKKIQPLVRSFFKLYTVDCDNIHKDYRKCLKKENVLKLNLIGDKLIVLPERGYKAQPNLSQYNVLNQFNEKELEKADFYEVNLKCLKSDVLYGDKILAQVKLYSKTPKTKLKILEQ